MGEYKNKTYPLRIENELMDKIRIIAKTEDRKINQQIERMLRKAVNDYEAVNGEVKIETETHSD